MVTVPRISESRVRSQPLPGQSFRVDAEPGAFSAGVNTTPLSDTMVAIVEAEKKRADNIKVRGAKNRLVAANNEFMAQATQQRGKNAMSLPDEYNEFHRKQVEEISNDLSNGAQKNAFGAYVSEEYLSRTKTLGKHVSAQTYVYDNNELASAMENNRQRAIQNANDPEEIAFALSEIRHNVNEYAEHNGFGKEEKEAMMFDEISKSHIGIIDTLITSNTELAEAYYDINKEDIDQGDLSKKDLDSMIDAYRTIKERQIEDSFYDLLDEEKLDAGIVKSNSQPIDPNGLGGKKREFWLNLIKKDQKAELNEIATVKTEQFEKDKKYIELVNKLVSDETDSFTMKEVLVEAYHEGGLSKEERKKLKKITKILKDIEFKPSFTNWGFKKSAKKIMEAIDDLGDESVANALRKLVEDESNVDKSEEELDKITDGLIREQRVIKNPNISQYNDGDVVSDGANEFKVIHVNGKPTFKEIK